MPKTSKKPVPAFVIEIAGRRWSAHVLPGWLKKDGEFFAGFIDRGQSELLLASRYDEPFCQDDTIAAMIRTLTREAREQQIQAADALKKSKHIKWVDLAAQSDRISEEE